MTSPVDTELRRTLRRRRAWIAEHSGGDARRRGFISPAEGDPDQLLSPGRRRSSLLVHRLGEASSHAWAGLGVGIAVVAWLVVGAVTAFPGWWLATLDAAGTCVTLVMVFAIQHTQSRQQSATQRKLDELLRAIPTADNRLIAVEEAPDAELQALADLNLADRETATGA